jgi:Kef-type K+ transport system membrane component KefB
VKQFLGAVLVLAIGFAASHRVFGRVRAWGQERFFYLTGEEFLLLGLALGPLGANLIDAGTLAMLDPFLGLGLGYVGFAFGMQFRVEDLLRVPGRYYAATGLQSLTGFLVLFPPIYLALARWAPSQGPSGPLALAVAASAAGTSTSFLFRVGRGTHLGRSEVFRFLRFCSSFEDLFGVALFAVALALLRSEGRLLETGWAALPWLAVALAVGLLSGGLLLLVTRIRLDSREVLLFLLGIVLFTGGLAAHLGVSPVFTNLIAGVLVANLAPRRARTYHGLLLRVEKPLYVFLLVVAGALWTLTFTGLLPLLLVYAGCRMAGKWAGGRVALPVLLGRQGNFSGYGMGLTAQSEMSLVLMVNLLVLHEDPRTQLAVSVVFLAAIANALLSSAYFTRQARGN